MKGKKRTLEDLAGLSDNELEEIFRNGKIPDPEKLVGWEFRGYNVPFITKLLGIKKFKKGFYKKKDEYWGYNIQIYQGPIEEPWRCKPVDHNPRRMGFFSVKKVIPEGPENKEQDALILNYGDGKNLPWDGSFLRDYLKQVDPNNNDLYLGKAYTAIGRARVMPSFFIIERDRKAPTEVDR
ncbi:MAG: hypothetical protein JSU92_02750 [Deltaproteobacteria bacterium]|nr:MAG: hypothetical protein JSU92_02750 [Deltaproteobacteria bacterium]